MSNAQTWYVLIAATALAALAIMTVGAALSSFAEARTTQDRFRWPNE
ncbi:hypothetical protein [Streptomyces sp. NPDC048611]